MTLALNTVWELDKPTAEIQKIGLPGWPEPSCSKRHFGEGLVCRFHIKGKDCKLEICLPDLNDQGTPRPRGDWDVPVYLTQVRGKVFCWKEVDNVYTREAILCTKRGCRSHGFQCLKFGWWLRHCFHYLMSCMVLLASVESTRLGERLEKNKSSGEK